MTYYRGWCGSQLRDDDQQPSIEVGVDLDVEARVGDQPIEADVGPSMEMVYDNQFVEVGVGLDAKVMMATNL